MYIILVRHGETDFNKEGKVQGSEVDPPLNEMGIKQASLTGEFIKKHFKIDKIYSSQYKRAKQTALNIREIIGYNDKILINKNLKEGDKGLLSGKDKNEVNELFKSNIKFKNLKLKCDKYDHYEKLNAMYDNDKISKLMKKETFREIGKRAKSVIKNIIKDNLNKNILIVTHGSFIANGIRNIFDLRQIPEKTVGNGNCSLTVIKLGNNKKELIMSYNNIHLNELY